MMSAFAFYCNNSFFFVLLFCFCSCEFSKLHSSRGDISQHGRSYPASSCCLASEWWPSSFPELLDWRIPRLSVCTFAAPILQRYHNNGDCWFCVWECSCCLPGLYNINPCWRTWRNYQHNHRPGDPTSSLIFFFQGFVAHTLEKMHPFQTHSTSFWVTKIYWPPYHQDELGGRMCPRDTFPGVR